MFRQFLFVAIGVLVLTGFAQAEPFQYGSLERRAD
jgi:hypothetical protein